MASEHDELWQVGQTHYIPRLRGKGHYCKITRLTPTQIDFDGPTGPASITRELYRTIMGDDS